MTHQKTEDGLREKLNYVIKEEKRGRNNIKKGKGMYPKLMQLKDVKCQTVRLEYKGNI